MNLLLKRILSTAVPMVVTLLLVSCEDDDKKSFAKPDVIEITPGEALIGETITLKGDRLDDVSRIKFGAVDATEFTTSSNEITVTVPDGLEEGKTKVTVFYQAASENNLGASDFAEFNVLYGPLLTDVNPASAKPGFQVVIAGNFLKRTTQVKFGDTEVSFVADQTSITATVPSDAIVGDSEVSVTTPGGTTTIPFTIAERTPEVHAFSPADGGRTGDEITVTGIFFMNVQSVKIGSKEVDDFEVVNATELKFEIPEGASTNKVTVTTPLGSGESEESLTVIEIPFVLFDEGLHAQMQNWGWGGNDDFGSSVVAKTGTKSYSRTYTEGWSGVQLHHGTLNLSVYSAVKFSVYGGPGTTGKILNMNINWGASTPVTLTAGQWTDYTIPLSTLGSPGVLDNLIFQEKGDAGVTPPFTVYIDNIVFIE